MADALPTIVATPQIAPPERDTDSVQNELDADSEGQRDAPGDIPRSSTKGKPRVLTDPVTPEQPNPCESSDMLDSSFSTVYATAESISTKTGLPIRNIFSHWSNEFDRITNQEPIQTNADSDSGVDGTTSESEEEAGYSAAGASTLTRKLRKQFGQKAGTMGLKLVNGTGLKWDTLPNLLAEQGIYIDNWPEETKFPGNYESTKGTKRGLWSLTICERETLLKAMDDPHHPLEFKPFKRQSPEDIKELEQSQEPVIICAPPAAHSKCRQSCRLFLNGEIDHKGHLKYEKRSNTPARARVSTRSAQKRGESESTRPKIEEERKMGGKPRPKAIPFSRSATGGLRTQAEKQKRLMSPKFSRPARRTPSKRKMSSDVKEAEEKWANSRKRKRSTFGNRASTAAPTNDEESTSAIGTEVKQGTGAKLTMEDSNRRQTIPPTSQNRNVNLPVPLSAAPEPQSISRFLSSASVEHTLDHVDPAQFGQPQTMYGPSHVPEPAIASYPPLMYPQATHRGVVYQAPPTMPVQPNYPWAFAPGPPFSHRAQQPMMPQPFQPGADQWRGHSQYPHNYPV